MSTPTEEGAAAAQPHADINELVSQFRQKLALQSQLLEENAPQQELLKKVSANAHKVCPLQLTKMLKEIEEHGKLITVPEEAIAAEAEEHVPPPEPQASSSAAETAPENIPGAFKQMYRGKEHWVLPDTVNVDPTVADDDDLSSTEVSFTGDDDYQWTEFIS